MPELPRVHNYYGEKLRANTLFVDREEPQALFRNELDDLVHSGPSPRLLTFYGVGGQGKSALCRQLMRLAREPENAKRGLRCSLIDLQLDVPKGEWHAYISIRNAVAAASGASFPCFDLAFADYWSLAAPHEPEARLGANRLQGFGSDASETVADSVAGIAKDSVTAALDGWTKTVADIASEVAGGLPFIGPLLKRTSRWAISAGYQTLLKHNAAALGLLYGADAEPAAATILAHLPDILAHELALHLKSKDQYLVLLIDEYERVMHAGGSEGLIRADPWDQGLRAFYASCALGSHQPTGDRPGYVYDVPMLLVLFGREKIRWDEIDSGWQADLDKRQHLLDGLADKDADLFLRQAGLANVEIRHAIVAAATAYDPLTKAEAAYPLMLDMSVQLYYDMLAQGEQPTPQTFDLMGKTYDARRGDLLRRILRRYPSEIHGLLQRLACTLEFDRDVAARLIANFHIPFDMIRFAELERLSFISSTEDGRRLAIHSHIRDTLIAALNQQDLHETRQMLADLFCMRATPSDRTVNVQHARAFAEAIRIHAEGYLKEGLLFYKPRVAAFAMPQLGGILIGALRHAVAVERKREGNEYRLAEALYRIAWLQASTKDADEARISALEAIELLHGSGADDTARLAKYVYILASACNSLGRYEEALTYYERSAELRRDYLPADDESFIATGSNIATVLVNMGKPDEATGTYSDLLDTVLALDPDHPLVARLAYNLGVSLFRTSRHVKARLAYIQALDSAERHLSNDDPLLAKICGNLGLALLELNHLDDAAGYLERGVAISTQIGLPVFPYTLLGYARIQSGRGNHQAAIDLLDAIPSGGLPSDQLSQDSSLEADYVAVRSLYALGKKEEATARCERALIAARKSKFSYRLINLLGQRADIHFYAAEFEAAITVFEEQIALQRERVARPSILLAFPLRKLGECHLNLNDPSNAIAYLLEAHQQYLELFGEENTETRLLTLRAGVAAHATEDHAVAEGLLASMLKGSPIDALETNLFRNAWAVRSIYFASEGRADDCAHAEEQVDFFDSQMDPEMPQQISVETLRQINREILEEKP